MSAEPRTNVQTSDPPDTKDQDVYYPSYRDVPATRIADRTIISNSEVTVRDSRKTNNSKKQKKKMN